MMGCTWTPRRPNDTFARSRIPPPPPLLSSPGTSARLCSPEASHYITFVLHFFKTLFFCVCLPTPHPVSCITLLQTPRRDPRTHQLGSSHRQPTGRSLFGWRLFLIGGEKDGVSCLRGGKKIKRGRKKNQNPVIFLWGIFLFFPISYGRRVLLAGKCMF